MPKIWEQPPAVSRSTNARLRLSFLMLASERPVEASGGTAEPRLYGDARSRLAFGELGRGEAGVVVLIAGEEQHDASAHADEADGEAYRRDGGHGLGAVERVLLAGGAALVGAAIEVALFAEGEEAGDTAHDQPRAADAERDVRRRVGFLAAAVGRRHHRADHGGGRRRDGGRRGRERGRIFLERER